MITIPKKGCLSQPSNYRGITLTSISSKVYNLLLLNRISKHLEPMLRENPNGYRKGPSNLPQILALRRIIEEIKIANRKAPIVFVHFSKAFHSINRSAKLHILHLYGLPDEIIAGIKTMYDNPETFVLSPDGTTDSFFTTTGILQGNIFTPYLFTIVVDYVPIISITLQERKSTCHSSKQIADLNYADDIALLSDQINNVEILLQSLETAAHKVGLH